MKEATGELNMTVVTVVAIAAIAGFFYAFVWPAIKQSITSSTKCADAVCPASCKTDGVCDCYYIDESGEQQEVKCKVQNAMDDNNRA